MEGFKNYWFQDLESGEEFFVVEQNRKLAFELAKHYFGEDAELKCYGVVDEVEAELMGLDTY